MKGTARWKSVTMATIVYATNNTTNIILEAIVIPCLQVQFSMTII